MHKTFNVRHGDVLDDLEREEQGHAEQQREERAQRKAGEVAVELPLLDEGAETVADEQERQASGDTVVERCEVAGRARLRCLGVVLDRALAAVPCADGLGLLGAARELLRVAERRLRHGAEGGRAEHRRSTARLLRVGRARVRVAGERAGGGALVGRAGHRAADGRA
jgi:hypothetical protein